MKKYIFSLIILGLFLIPIHYSYALTNWTNVTVNYKRILIGNFDFPQNTYKIEAIDVIDSSNNILTDCNNFIIKTFNDVGIKLDNYANSNCNLSISVPNQLDVMYNTGIFINNSSSTILLDNKNQATTNLSILIFYIINILFFIGALTLVIIGIKKILKI